MRLVALSTVLFCTTLAVAQEEVLQFEQANQSYRNGDYKKAAQLYEKILDNGYESAALYYDLGNCYFKLENIPATILSYERARRLAPHDEDISYNLRLANLRVVDKIDALPRLFFVDWGTALMNMFSSDGWALVEIVSLWCAMLCGVTFFLFRSVVIQRF